MKFMQAQRGISVLGALFMLLVVSTLTGLALKLLPHYMDFYSLQNIITAKSAERAYDVRSAHDFYDYVERGMTVNSIRELGVRDIMAVNVSMGSVEVALDYEVREPLIGNIEVVLTFQRDYHIPQ